MKQRFEDVIPTHHERGKWRLYINHVCFKRVSCVYISDAGDMFIYDYDGIPVLIADLYQDYGIRDYYAFRKPWANRGRPKQRLTNH